MSQSPDIRRGSAADLPAVSTLLKGAGLPTADLRTSDLQIWLVESENGPVGVIALQRFGSEGLLRSLAVIPEFRERGVGRRLVARLENDARADGVKQLVLLTETAERFFRNLGYSVIDRSSVGEAPKRSSEFQSLCPVSAVCMSKTLAAAPSQVGV
jgi:amino-acid N-acetyltransferase